MAAEDFGKTPSLKQLVYENLKSRIISGELRPGARLLEGELSKSMAISRAPIREALNMLDRDGLATIMPRRGAIVTIFTKDDVRYIWEMRGLLEPYAARLSASKVLDTEIDQVEELLMAVLQSPRDLQQYSDSDLALHDLLYRHLSNRYMKSALLNLRDHSLCIRWNAEREADTFDQQQQDFICMSTEEHLAILRALRARDEQAAAAAVQTHLIQSCKRTMIGAE